MQRFEDENGELAKHIQELQSQLAEAEQQHAQRLIDLTTRHRAETEMETERLRTAQLQAERLLDTRERAHRQKIRGLEEMISTLKDQLSTEVRKRQNYISHSVRTGDEIRDIRNILDNSLSNVVRDPSLDPILLASETQKLDDSLDVHGVPTKLSSPRRRTPKRTISPMRYGMATSTPAFRRTTSPSSLRHKLKK
ncbi:hypothetical protein ScPMuIL_008909 [Solemya velum]